MRKIADIETWEAVGSAAGWIKSAAGDSGEPVDRWQEGLKAEFIERMKLYGMTDEEIKRALESGHLERLERLLKKP